MEPKRINRRGFLGTIGKAGAVALAAGIGFNAPNTAAAATTESTPTGGFTLPPLPYAYDALEPFIDTQTMILHHTRHHGAAVTSLNTALKDYPALGQRTIVDLLAHINTLPEAIRTPVRNLGGSHLNHSIFWATMAPNAGSQPVGGLANDIATTFGSFAAFQARLSDVALRIFGSGWAWLVMDQRGGLQVISRPNQDAPIMDGLTPLVGIDMFEHAHYLKYQNRRNEYVSAWFNVINWHGVILRYEHTRRTLGI
jgi:superoxide dismutase, Fe-Mn family